MIRIQIAVSSLILLAGCAGQTPPTPSEKDATTQLSEGVGDAVGSAVSSISKGLINFLPGVKPAIEGVSKQLDNRNKRAQDRKANKAQAEQDAFKMQYCIANECNPSCKEFLTERVGITPFCETPAQSTSFVPTKRSQDLQPSNLTQIVEREGMRTNPYKDHRGIEHTGIGSRTYGNGSTTSIEDVKNQFGEDLEESEKIAMDFAGETAWRRMTINQRDALIEASFALGRTGLNRFIKMRSFIRALDFDAAARELEDSMWAQSDPSRVKALASNLRVKPAKGFELAR